MTEANKIDDSKSSRMRWFTGAVILLMIVLMVFSSNTLRNQQRMQHGVLIGSSSVGDVMSQDSQEAARLLDLLESVSMMVPSPDRSQPPEVVPLLSGCWGDAVVRDLKAHPEAFALTLRESRRVSPGASFEAIGSLEAEKQSDRAIGMFNSGFVAISDLRPLPAARLATRAAEAAREGRGFGAVELRVIQRTNDGRVPQLAPNSLAPLDQANLYTAMSDFLTIQSAASLPLNAIKPTSPLVERTLAQLYQTFTLQLGTVDALQLLAKVPDPTDDDLRNQLAAYGDRVPDAPDRDHPFPFGYRIPDAVKLEVLSFRRDDVFHTVEAEKTPYQWEVAARMEFAKSPPPQSTAPTTVPSTQASAPPTFEAVREKMIAEAKDRATDARAVEIERSIRSEMVNDYQVWITARKQSASAATSQAADSSYTSADYLQRVAANITAKHKVTPNVLLLNDKFYDLSALKEVAGFASATRPLPLNASRREDQPTELSGPEYATEYARDLVDPTIADAYASVLLEKFKPSERLVVRHPSDGKEGEIFIFRVSDTRKNQPAKDIEPLRDRLKSDWRVVQAQNLALEQGEGVVKAITGGADFEAALKAVEPTSQVFTSDIGPLAASEADKNPLNLPVPQFRQFAAQMTERLIAAEPTVATFNVPLAGKVYVAKRLRVRSLDDLPKLEQQLRSEFAQDMALPKSANHPYGLSTEDFAATWLDSKQTLARLAYKPVRSDDTSKQ